MRPDYLILDGEASLPRLWKTLKPVMLRSRRVQVAPTVAQIVDAVSVAYDLKPQALTGVRRPHGELTVARNLAMWPYQVRAGLTLNEIAEVFHLSHYNNVSTAIVQVKQGLQHDARLCDRLATVRRHLDACYSNP